MIVLCALGAGMLLLAVAIAGLVGLLVSEKFEGSLLMEFLDEVPVGEYPALPDGFTVTESDLDAELRSLTWLR